MKLSCCCLTTKSIV